MPRCLQAWASWKQKLIVRMFCSIDSMLWLLNTYLKYQQNLLLCFDIWTSYIMSDMYLDSHTSTCQSWKIKDLFFSENCFVPVSKYQVAMVTATLVNRATLPPYRSKSNTKGRQNRLGSREQKSLGENPHHERDKPVSDRNGSCGRWPHSPPDSEQAGSRKPWRMNSEQLCKGTTERLCFLSLGKCSIHSKWPLSSPRACFEKSIQQDALCAHVHSVFTTLCPFTLLWNWSLACYGVRLSLQFCALTLL